MNATTQPTPYDPELDTQTDETQLDIVNTDWDTLIVDVETASRLHHAVTHIKKLNAPQTIIVHGNRPLSPEFVWARPGIAIISFTPITYEYGMQLRVMSKDGQPPIAGVLRWSGTRDPKTPPRRYRAEARLTALEPHDRRDNTWVTTLDTANISGVDIGNPP